MQAMEFGKEYDRKIVLIPGNMMSWRQFENITLNTLQNCMGEALRLYEVIDKFEPAPNCRNPYILRL